jgi:hypothetical protein
MRTYEIVFKETDGRFTRTEWMHKKWSTKMGRLVEYALDRADEIAAERGKGTKVAVTSIRRIN